jgi:hypothetical protein
MCRRGDSKRTTDRSRASALMASWADSCPPTLITVLGVWHLLVACRNWKMADQVCGADSASMFGFMRESICSSSGSMDLVSLLAGEVSVIGSVFASAPAHVHSRTSLWCWLNYEAPTDEYRHNEEYGHTTETKTVGVNWIGGYIDSRVVFSC